MTKTATPTERQLKKQRIAEDKARAARWASRRRSLRAQEESQDFPVATPSVVQASVLPPENTVLQDLLDRRTTLVQELKDLDTAIAVIQRTYGRR